MMEEEESEQTEKTEEAPGVVNNLTRWARLGEVRHVGWGAEGGHRV